MCRDSSKLVFPQALLSINGAPFLPIGRQVLVSINGGPFRNKCYQWGPLPSLIETSACEFFPCPLVLPLILKLVKISFCFFFLSTVNPLKQYKIGLHFPEITIRGLAINSEFLLAFYKCNSQMWVFWSHCRALLV